jgi:uncharacterized hydrophobic protein (TIGR00271 family)
MYIKIRFWWIQTQKKLKTLLGLSADDPWDMVFDNVFDRLAIMRQTDEGKAEISKRVNEGISTGKLYWLEVILSALIATLGLMQNSVAVIIGAMLIAPLLRPIQGLAYSIALGRPSLFAKALRLLGLSVLVSILVPMTVLFFFPGAESTAEIAARTQPNLLDLLIAIFSAIVAILAFAYKRLHESIAGVAMATAIMPPLVVIGMQIWWGSWALALGATLLFITNLVAILVVGAVLFLFYGFNPHRNETESSIGKLAFLVLTLTGLWFILSYNLSQIQSQNAMQERAEEVLQKQITLKLPGTEIENIFLSEEEDTLVINGTLLVPESVNLTQAEYNEIEAEVSKSLNQSVYLGLNMVRTISFGADQ